MGIQGPPTSTEELRPDESGFRLLHSGAKTATHRPTWE